MPGLSDAISIRGNRIKNRIVMLPMVTFSFRGDGGNYYGRQHVEHYRRRAKGGAGLLIVQATQVDNAREHGGMWTRGSQEALREIAANSHLFGAAAIMQLACGDVDINALSGRDLRSMQADMTAAAIIANGLGFDGAEFHFAHGYTLNSLLDAARNRRVDEFGGTPENRTRILTGIIREIRENVRDNFIIAVRMGEYIPTSADGLAAARIFDEAGIDLFNVSFGHEQPEGPAASGFPLSATTYSSYQIKKVVRAPVIAVNGIFDGEQARFVVENSYADFAGIGRGMLADAEFANRVLGGLPVDRCRDCGECLWFTDHRRCPAARAEG